MGYVDLLDFGKTWPACWSDIDAQKGLRLLQNLKYFSCGAPMRDEHRNFFVSANFKIDLVRNQ